MAVPDEQSPSPAIPTPPVEAAREELARLHALIAEARQRLASVHQDIQAAETQLNELSASLLLEANEQLVISAMRLHAQAEAKSRALDHVTRISELDGLTSLPTRSALLSRFEVAIAHARRHGAKLAVIFLDLNGFKRVNDSLGHGVGDVLLQRIAASIASALREVDPVSRHGGDEFVVLLTEVHSPSDVTFVAAKISAALATPMHAGGHVLCLSASMGVSLYPDDGEFPDVLIERADQAMYHAKRLGRSAPVFFSESSVPTAASPESCAAATLRCRPRFDEGGTGDN